MPPGKAAASKPGGRIALVDATRAAAILLMVVFHFCYDLRYFGYVDWQVPDGPGWWQFRYFILSLFIGTVGVSLSLAHGAGVRWRNYWLRLAQIGAAALAITLMSLWVFPESWIYFGILHFIVLGSLVGILLVGRPGLALALGVSLVAGYAADMLPSRWPFGYFDGLLPQHPEDLVPPFPWLGVLLIGVWMGDLLRRGLWSPPSFRLPIWVDWAARHALLIYLLHQPLLFGVFIALAA